MRGLQIFWYCIRDLSVPGGMRGSCDDCLQRWVCQCGWGDRRLRALWSHLRRWLRWSWKLHCLRICWYCMGGLSVPGNMHDHSDDWLRRQVGKRGRVTLRLVQSHAPLVTLEL